MKSFLSNYRQSPRKVRLLADLVRGKKVGTAIDLLTFTFKRGSLPMVKVIKSAIQNAVHNNQANPETLFIKDVQVNKGLVMKRMMPRARGSAFQILKRTSHVSVVLEDASMTGGKQIAAPAPKKGKAAKASEAKPDKEVQAKKVTKTKKETN
mgnify:CR=1 FL=1